MVFRPRICTVGSEDMLGVSILNASYIIYMATQLTPSTAFATRSPSFNGLGKLLSKFKNWLGNRFSRNKAPECLDTYLKQAEKLKVKIAQDQLNAKMVGLNTFAKF